MCCLFTTLVLFGPRLAILVWWLIDSVRFTTVFSSFIWPLLGFIFLPWTTLMYLLVAPNGLIWFDWFWLGLALLIDLGSLFGGGYGNRHRIRSYSW
jgi:hypothetical protein